MPQRSILFSFETDFAGRVKARPADRNFGRERSAAGLHASRDSLYRTARGGRQDRRRGDRDPADAAASAMSALRQADRSSVTDGGSNKRTTNGTSRSGFAAVSVVHARRHSRSCPIGRRRQGTTASTVGNKRGSCCASRQQLGAIGAARRRTRRDRQTHRPATVGRTLAAHAALCWRRCSGRLPVASAFRRLPPSLPGIRTAIRRILPLEARSP